MTVPIILIIFGMIIGASGLADLLSSKGNKKFGAITFALGVGLLLTSVHLLSA